MLINTRRLTSNYPGPHYFTNTLKLVAIQPQFLGLNRFGLTEFPFCMVLVFRIYSLYSNLQYYLPPPSFWCRLRSTGHKFHRVLKVPVSAQLNSGCQYVRSAVTYHDISLLIRTYMGTLRYLVVLCSSSEHK